MRTRLSLYPLHLDMEGDPSGPGTATVVAPAEPATRSNDSQPGLRGDTDAGAIARTMRDLRAAVSRGEVGLAGQAPTTPPVASIEVPAAAPEADPASPEATAEPVAEAAAAVADDAAGELPAAGEPDPLLTIELPARRGQEPVQIQVEDRETAEALRRMKNAADRVEQAEARAREARAAQVEYEQFEQHLTLDPIGFVVDRMNPAYRVQVAEQLLAEDGVLEAVLERLDNWQSNPDRRVADQARFEANRLRNAGTVRQQVQARETQRTIVENITTNVNALSELVDPELAAQFRDDALGDMAAFARSKRLTGPLAPEHFPELLARRLRLYGVDPTKAAAALTDAGSTPHSSARPRPKGPAAQALAASPAAQGARANGAALVTAKRIRQAAAAAVPGAGAAITVPTQAKPEKGSGVKGAIEFLRRQLPGAGR